VCSTDLRRKSRTDVDSWRVAFLRRRRVTPPAAAARDCAAVAEQSALWRERRGWTEQSAPFRARRSSRQWGAMWRHEAGLGSHGPRASVASRSSGAFERRHEAVWAMKEIVASRKDVAAQPLPLTAGGAPRLHPRGGSSRGGGGARHHRGERRGSVVRRRNRLAVELTAGLPRA
jgi:hypothetical protein